MSLFSWIRKTFGGGGGIAARIALPVSFIWEDKVLPITITLEGHKTEPRTVEELRFRFISDENTDDNDHTRAVDVPWDVREEITLAPGETRVITVEMPLPFDLDAIEAEKPVTSANASRTEKILGNVIRASMQAPTHIRQYKVTLSARVQGARIGAGASAKVRFGAAFYKGPSTITFGRGN